MQIGVDFDGIVIQSDIKFWIVKQIHTFVKIHEVDLDNN